MPCCGCVRPSMMTFHDEVRNSVMRECKLTERLSNRMTSGTSSSTTCPRIARNGSRSTSTTSRRPRPLCTSGSRSRHFEWRNLHLRSRHRLWSGRALRAAVTSFARRFRNALRTCHLQSPRVSRSPERLGSRDGPGRFQSMRCVASETEKVRSAFLEISVPSL